MTALNPLAPYRELVLAGMRRQIDALAYTHATLMREQLLRHESDTSLVLPGALCLLTAELLRQDASPSDTPSRPVLRSAEGSTERGMGGEVLALPAASALALLEMSVLALSELAIESAGAPSGLAGMWGMPRTLNAGDAFYALGQTSMLRLKETSIGDEAVLTALDAFDTACRAASEALDAGTSVTQALMAPALRLGGLLAGASSDTLAALSRVADAVIRGDAVDTSGIEMPAASRTRFEAAVVYVGRGGGR